MKFRQLNDGTIYVVHRGKPPACPEGYEQLSGDPYTFRPILHACKDRVVRRSKSQCPTCGQNALWCNRNNRIVTRGDCKLCQQK